METARLHTLGQRRLKEDVMIDKTEVKQVKLESEAFRDDLNNVLEDIRDIMIMMEKRVNVIEDRLGILEGLLK